MSFGTLFSAVVKPEKPLLYICDQSTHITNIAVCPTNQEKKRNNASVTTISPFATILKLQYEGPVVEGENDDEEKENIHSQKPNGAKSHDKNTKKSIEQDEDEEDEDEDAEDKDEDVEDEDEDKDDSDFADGIEAKEVVIGIFTPNTMQITADLYLAPDDQYRFVVSGSSDYEVHLLGRYIPDPLDDDSDNDFDDEMNDGYLDEISTDQEGSDGPKIEEISDDGGEPAPKPKKIVSPPKNAEKPNKAKEQKSNKRPLEDKETDADISMADSVAASITEGGAKLSKSQRKKLKKAKLAEAGSNKDADGETKPTESSKAPEVKETPASNIAPKTITLPSGLKIVDVKTGTGADAKPGQTVAMRYIGKLADGKVFDSNTKGKPFSFKLGKGQVIKGWDEGIKGMKIGGERKLVIPAILAYGKSGSPPDIPPNSTLTFEVKLLKIQ